jgi:hypothetical protein
MTTALADLKKKIYTDKIMRKTSIAVEEFYKILDGPVHDGPLTGSHCNAAPFVLLTPGIDRGPMLQVTNKKSCVNHLGTPKLKSANHH